MESISATNREVVGSNPAFSPLFILCVNNQCLSWCLLCTDFRATIAGKGLADMSKRGNGYGNETRVNILKKVKVGENWNLYVHERPLACLRARMLRSLCRRVHQRAELLRQLRSFFVNTWFIAEQRRRCLWKGFLVNAV